MRKGLLLIGIVMVHFSLLLAQTGTLRGKVTDQDTGEELIGTTVLLLGTLQGAATDLDGNFSIPAIDQGKYDIRVSFISYETQVVTGVIIEREKINLLNISLKPVSMGLSEVVVEAKAVKNTETAILTIQRKSVNMIEGISSQQIARTNDSDAASALKRVTGISVEGGKYVYVRGLGDRYSLTALNGAELPGLDPNRNTVQMDLFPSNIIDNMIIHKTFSPDLPGSFSGGYINIVTKDFPEKFTFQFGTSTEYNTNSSWTSNFLTYKGGANDWLGYDDGTRDIPGDATGHIPALFENNDGLDEITRSFNKIWGPEMGQTYMNHSHSLSLGNQIAFLGKPLGLIASMSYSRKYNFYDGGIVGRYRLVGSNSEKLNKDAYYEDSRGTMDAFLGGMLSVSYRPSPNNKINFNMLFNHHGEKLTRYMFGEVPSDGSGRSRETRTLGFTERSLNSFQLKGEHYIEKLNGLRINWFSAYSISRQEEPDLRFFTNSFYPELSGESAYAINTSEYADPARYFRDMKEFNLDNKVDFSLPFNLFSSASKLKFGGAFVYKDRTFLEKRYNFTTQQPEMYNGNIDDYFRDSNIGQAGIEKVTGNYGIYIQASEDENKRNSYLACQTVVSGYAMLNMPLTEKLTIIAGVRLEAADIHSESLNPDKPAGNLTNSDFLPALNILYGISKVMNLRGAYTRTLARPTFRELAPYASFDFQGDYVVVGNAELERTLIDNVDLKWEWFMKPGEIFSVGTFYKRFINPIERTFNPEAGNDELTWRNVNEAKVFGVEADLRKQLDFIPSLRKFKLGLNVTFVKSQVNVDERELSTIHATEPDYPSTRAMFGQSPYIINALLSYDNIESGWQSNLSYNVIGKRMVMVILGGTPNIFEQPAGLINFNVSKFFGDHISLKFSAENLLNPLHKKTYTRWNEDSSWKGEEYLFENYSVGRKFALSFTYNIR